MLSINSIDIEMQSAESMYKQQNLLNTLTDTKNQDPKSLIKIGQPNYYLRALPEQTSGFCRYIFLCLFNIFRQWHVIYFIAFAVAKTFYLCEFEEEAMIGEIVLIVIYLGLEIYVRYKTYTSYLVTELRLKQNYFQVWSNQSNYWRQTQYSDLKSGHIIKIHSSIHNNNILNPVNFLPIYLSSKKNHFQLKTTKINKFEEVKEIPLIPVFKKIINDQNFSSDTIRKLNQLKISFQYTIENSNIFQGRLKVSENQQYSISNRNILPEGVPIINEDFIIGVILINSSNINEKSLKRALNAENQTIIKAGHTMVPLALFLTFIGIITFIIQLLIIITDKNKRGALASSTQTYLCLALGILSIFSYFIYIGLFIFLLIHRLRDSHVLNRNSQILMKNHIKSIDEFGQTNTIIMDDYFFIDKNLFQVKDMICNVQTQFNFDQQLIYSIIGKSEMIKDQMYDLWISTLRYFRNKPRRYTKIQKQYNAQIMKQKIFKESVKYSTISLMVEINNASSQESIKTEKYILRFTQKPRYTSIERIKDQELKRRTKSIINMKDLLHIMVQVMRVDSSYLDEDTETYQLVSRNFEANRYQFLALISHKINSNPYIFPLSLIKNEELTKKQNLIILSNKKWKYIELILEKNQIDTGHTVSLEQKQFQNIKYDIEYHIRQLKDINTRQQRLKQINQTNQKHAILAIHCNLVSYLNSPEIKGGLIRLGRYCKYIIFYGCSQSEKQTCCMNLFEIYPLHIYLSNYLCDLEIIQKSYLSVCEKGESTQAYVTLVVKTYKDLQYLILNEAVESINITVFIMKSFLFKNIILILSMMFAQFMMYKGDYFEMGSQYTGVIFLMFNIFTSLPVVYYIFFRPEVWQEPIYKNNDPNKLFRLQYINDRKAINQFIRAIFISGVIAITNYSFLVENAIENLFFCILTSCVVAATYYQLFIDDALQKRVQVFLAIATYFLFFIFIYFLQLWNQERFTLVLIQTNITSKDTIYFFVSNLVVIPFILGYIFYGMSVLSAKISSQDPEDNDLKDQSLSMLEIPAKTAPEHGKELHFRDF